MEPARRWDQAEGRDPMRVMVADDSLMLCEGPVRLLTEHDMEVIGSAGTADKLLVLVADNPPDVAIIDIRMPPTHTDEGPRAALSIGAKHWRCWSSPVWKCHWPCRSSASRRQASATC